MTENIGSEGAFFSQIQMGIGTWQWGDRLFWGFGRGYGETDLHQVFETSIKAGIRFFDTAEAYGQGLSERYLGKFIKESGEPAMVATKFMPYPWRLWRGTLIKALRNSLKRLGLGQVDLYQIHWPFPPVTVETWMEAMAEAQHSGLTRQVGVSNYDRQQTQRAQETLIRQGVALASNQVEYHLLNRRIEKTGLMNYCQEQGIAIIAYSPIAQGLLSGKYTPENPPAGARGNRYSKKYLKQIQPLLNLMKKIGAEHDGKTPAQVAINWTICKGTIPIPGVKNLEQLEQNLGALGWSLTEEEIHILDEFSEKVAAG